MQHARTSFSILLCIFLLCSVSEAAQDDEAGIRRFLEGLDAGDVPIVAGRTLNHPELVAQYYRAREHKPIWLKGSALSQQTDDMLTAIGDSVSHGFVAERYHRSTLEALQAANDVVSNVARELLLTDAFLSQALHRGRGAVFPPNLDADWQMPPAEVDVLALLQTTVKQRRRVTDVLDGLWPIDPEYRALLQRRSEIAGSGETVTVQIAPGPLIRPGQSGERVILVKERLLGPGDHDPLYDDALKKDVIAFQRSAGLEPDGIIGANTIDVMNATRVSWIERIDANLERWRWLPRETPDTYVRVNIAAFTLRAVENKSTAFTMNVIVGQPFRRTPVFTETIKYLVLNPSWNVPYSIATKDKLPLLKANAAEQAAKGFEAKKNGSDRFVPVDSIDWQGVTAKNFNYLLRQSPGPQNALGRIKFMLPNPNAVYLHDTPTRELFAKQERSFSSGCIRLEKPLMLAEWLLGLDRHPSAKRIDELLSGGSTETLYLKKPVPTYLVYFTAFTLDDGTVTFRRDIYGRDRELIDALRSQQS